MKNKIEYQSEKWFDEMDKMGRLLPTCNDKKWKVNVIMTFDVPITDDSIEKMAWDAMKQCFDPEIPVNIVDLGLVYDCTINKQSEKLYDINIKMTLTAPGCGMAGHIAGDVKHNVELIPGVQDVVVDIVWEPQWSQNMMSDAAKLQLGMM